MRTVVAVLRGGPSSEYDVSLKTGASVLEALDRERYDPRDIFISRSGQWHLHGVAVAPERALHGADVAFNAMHGQYGEDGQVQHLLEGLGVPYTGSDAIASATAFHKQRTREAAQALGIKVAHGVTVDNNGDSEALARQLFRSFPHPAIIKPVTGGSSVGTAIANNFHQLELALDEAFKVSPQALVEEYIKGREATVGVIDGFRGEKFYTLLPTEIIPPKSSPLYDYHAKYISDETQFICPAGFAPEVKQTLQDAARTIHESFKLSHYSRSDFIVSKRGVYFLEVNTLPGLTDHSNIPRALRAVGSSLSAFLDHIISLVRNKK